MFFFGGGGGHHVLTLYISMYTEHLYVLQSRTLNTTNTPEAYTKGAVPRPACEICGSQKDIRGTNRRISMAEHADEPIYIENDGRV